VKIDKLDRELMAQLFEDGRATLTSLGEKLGPALSNNKEKISHVAVQKRLQKLIDNEIIKVQANLNVVQLNYISAIILIETKEYDAQKRIIERFRLCPRVIFIDLVSGKYNIILRAMASSLKEMECFLNYCWLKQEEGIRNLEIYISTTNVKPKYIPMPTISIEEKRQIAPCGFRCNMCDLYKNKECGGCPASHFSDPPSTEILEPLDTTEISESES
jgi:Lrp/AsnC family transcriptional regulator for asnA, asnC and gidA